MVSFRRTCSCSVCKLKITVPYNNVRLTRHWWQILCTIDILVQSSFFKTKIWSVIPFTFFPLCPEIYIIIGSSCFYSLDRQISTVVIVFVYILSVSILWLWHNEVVYILRMSLLELGCAGGAIDSGLEWEIGKPSSNSIWVPYIHMHKYLGKGMNTSLPPAMG